VTVKWAAILFALFIVLIIVLADLGRLGILGYFNQLPFGDKAGHFILYGILTLLIQWSLLRSQSPVLRERRMRTIWIVGFLLMVLIGLEEFSQQFFAKRSFDLIDLSFSYLGVIFFSWLAIKTKHDAP
jgi:VanZ family protein